jgi:hypothetical protein
VTRDSRSVSVHDRRRITGWSRGSWSPSPTSPRTRATASIDVSTNGVRRTLRVPTGCAVVLANGTIEATRLALTSLGIGDTRFGAPRVGNLMAHLRSNITVRIRRTALGLPAGAPPDLETTAFLVRGVTAGRRFHFQVVADRGRMLAGSAYTVRTPRVSQFLLITFRRQPRLRERPGFLVG